MYVRRTNRTNMRRPLGARKYIKKRVYKRKPLGSRVAAYNKSRTRFYKSRTLSRRQNLTTETKLLPFKVINEQKPVAIQTLAKATQISYTLGGVPSSWSGFTDLLGMDPAVGTGSNQRIGSYIFLKKAHFEYEIDMAKGTDGGLPIEFRFIVAKSRRLAVPAGQNRDPNTSLFLALDGTDFGAGSTNYNGTDLMVQPLNKRIYTIYKDTKFILSNPLNVNSTATQAYTGHYPCMKRFSLDLPFYTKANFTGATKPTDVDYHWMIILYARSLDKDEVATEYEVNLRGVLSYSDP